jgi:adenylate kinase
MGLYIILMGVQGSGKGTQAKFLVEKYGIPHISTGDLFRDMKTLDTPLAREVQAYLKAGALVPDEITDRVAAERLQQDDAKGGAILDGYPRNLAQVQAFERMLAERGEHIALVLVLELDREIAIKRAEGRRYSQDKQRVYNIYFNPPKVDELDDVDGTRLIQREDDHREAVEKRIDIYFAETTPVIDYFRQKGLVKVIDANQSIEAVRDAVIDAVDAAKV